MNEEGLGLAIQISVKNFMDGAYADSYLFLTKISHSLNHKKSLKIIKKIDPVIQLYGNKLNYMNFNNKYMFVNGKKRKSCEIHTLLLDGREYLVEAMMALLEDEDVKIPGVVKDIFREQVMK